MSENTDSNSIQYTNLEVEVENQVAYITMDSESGKNSLTKDMGRELTDIAIELSQDESVRCIVLKGREGVYNTGADLSELEGNEKDGSVLKGVATPLHDAISTLKRAEKPVVTGVNGVAAGAGFSLAVFGDIVLVSEDTTLQFAYPGIGVTGDGGSTFFLPRLVGLRKAVEIAILDEPISGGEAVEMGLATEAVEGDEFENRLREIAESLAEGPTKAYGRTKRLMLNGLNRGLEEQMSEEAETIAEMTRTEDYAEGIGKFFTDEEPEFVGK